MKHEEPGFIHLSNIVKCGSKTWLVDTSETPFSDLETMIFASEAQPETNSRDDVDDSKIDWSGVYTEYYQTADEAKAGHERIVAHIEEYV